MVLTNVTSYDTLEAVPPSAYANSAFATFAALSETLNSDGDGALSETQQALQAGLARNLVAGSAAYSELASDQPSAQAIYEFVSNILIESNFSIDAERPNQQVRVWKDVIKQSPTYSGSTFSFKAYGQAGAKADTDSILTPLYSASGTNFGINGQNPFMEMRNFIQACKTTAATTDTDFATTSLSAALSNMTLSTKLNTQTQTTIGSVLTGTKKLATFLKDAFANLTAAVASRTLDANGSNVTAAKIATFVDTYTLASGTSIYSTAGATDAENTLNDQALITAILTTMMGATDLSDVDANANTANFAIIQLAINAIFSGEVAVALDTTGTDSNVDLDIPAAPIQGGASQAADLDLVATALDNFAKCLTFRSKVSQAASDATGVFQTGFVNYLNKNGASAQCSNQDYVDVSSYNASGSQIPLRSWWAANITKIGEAVEATATASSKYATRFSSTASLAVGGGSVYSVGSGISTFAANVKTFIEDESNGDATAAIGEVSMTYAGLSTSEIQIRNRLFIAPIIQHALTDNPTNRGEGWTLGGLSTYTNKFISAIDNSFFDMDMPEIDPGAILGATAANGPKISALLKDSGKIMKMNPQCIQEVLSNNDVALGTSIAAAMMNYEWLGKVIICDQTSDLLFANLSQYSSTVGTTNEKNSSGSTILFNTDGVASALDIAAENTAGGTLTQAEKIRYRYLLRQLECAADSETTYDQFEGIIATVLGGTSNWDDAAKASFFMGLSAVGSADGLGSIFGKLIANQGYTTLATYVARAGPKPSILTVSPNDQTGNNSSTDDTVLKLFAIWNFKRKFGGEELSFPAFVIREAGVAGFPSSNSVTYSIQTSITDTPTTVSNRTATEAVYALYEPKASTGFTVVSNTGDFNKLITRGGSQDPSSSTDMASISAALSLYFGETNTNGIKNLFDSYELMEGLIDYIAENPNLSYYKLGKPRSDVWKDMASHFRNTDSQTWERGTAYGQPIKDKKLSEEDNIKLWLVNIIVPDTGNEGEKLDTGSKEKYLTWFGANLDFDPRTRSLKAPIGATNTTSNGNRFQKVSFGLTGTAATDYGYSMFDYNLGDELEIVWNAIPDSVTKLGLTKFDLAINALSYIGTAPGSDTAAQDTNRRKLTETIVLFSDFNQLRAVDQGGEGYWYKKSELLSVTSSAHSAYTNATTNTFVAASAGSPTLFSLTSPTADYTNDDDSSTIITDIAVKATLPLNASNGSDQELFSLIGMEKLKLISEKKLFFKNFGSNTARTAYLSVDSIAGSSGSFKVLEYYIRNKLLTNDSQVQFVLDAVENADTSATASIQTTLQTKVEKMNASSDADSALDTLADNLRPIYFTLSIADQSKVASAAVDTGLLGPIALIVKILQDGPLGHSEAAMKKAVQFLGLKKVMYTTHFVNSRSNNTVFFDSNGSDYLGAKASYIAPSTEQGVYVYLNTVGQQATIKLQE